MFDEDTLDFYQYNLAIVSKETVEFALSYIMKILNIVLKQKENQEHHKELSTALKKVIDRLKLNVQQH